MDQPGNNHLLLRANQVTRPDATRPGGTSDRMRELLTRTAADHIADEWLAADAIKTLRHRLDTLERQVHDLAQTRQATACDATASFGQNAGQSLPGIAATLDGLAATQGSLEHKMSALDNRLERLDERLDDQYDRVTSLDGRLGAADAKIEALAGQFEQTRIDISGRLASLEETLYTLAEVLLRPAAR